MTRVPITAIVIVFEMTADFNLVLPLMIGSGVAYLIADRISPGSIYTRLLAWQGIALASATPTSNPWADLTADDLMQRRVETLASTMPLPEAVQAFSRSSSSGVSSLRQWQIGGHCHPKRFEQCRSQPGSFHPGKYHDSSPRNS